MPLKIDGPAQVKMSETIDEIYGRIKENLTSAHLKKISIDIINSYKNRDFRQLKKYGAVLNIEPSISSASLFVKLIKQFHPDKLLYFRKRAEEIYQSKDPAGMADFYGTFFFKIEFARPVPDRDIEFEAEFKYDEEDFGYREKSVDDDDNFGESSLDFGDDPNGFMDALNRMVFGGLDDTVTEYDLKNLDGSLDLSDYDICDLTGVEKCVYLNELNLSDNNIEKIGKLSALIKLKSLFLSNNQIEDINVLENLISLTELDISFNNITDISVLEKLPDLEYVNIMGNPVKDYSVVNTLVQNGVLVVFEHANYLD